MAPHRLTRGLKLRELAREALAQVDDHGSIPLRFRLIALTPTVCIEYVVELLLMFAAAIVGVTVLTGYNTSTVSEALPPAVQYAYGIGLLLGAGTVAWGLATKRYGTVVPIGLRLLCVILAAYVVAVLGVVGFENGVSTVILSALFSGLAGWRSFLLRSLFLLLARSSLVRSSGQL